MSKSPPIDPFGNDAVRYQLYAFTPQGDLIHTTDRPLQHAPGPYEMFNWGRRYGAAFVARWFPSRKGYRLLDIRKARVVEPKGHRPFATGFVQLQNALPTLDAVPAYLAHKCAIQRDLL